MIREYESDKSLHVSNFELRGEEVIFAYMQTSVQYKLQIAYFIIQA